jgi:predicted PurR-regulated permease PerM/phosphoglycolate phosphatase-like HAD superfamily hydrolase
MSQGPRWTPFTKQLVVVALLVGAAFLLLRVSVVIPPLIIALFFAYFISVGIPWVQRNTGWSRGASAALTEIFILLLVLTLPALIAPWLVNAVNGFITTLSKVINELLSATPKPIEVTSNLVINLGPFYQPINAWLRGIVGPELGNLQNLEGLQGLQGLLPQFTSGVTTVLKGAISGFVYLFFILVIAFYTARDGWRLGRFASERVPDEWRPELSRLWRELALIWDSFVRGQLLLALTVGLLVWISMTILGVRNAPVLGLISAVLEFVPSIGPVLAAFPGVAIALVLGSSWIPLPNVWFAALVGFVYFLIQQAENLYLLPRVVGARIRLHPAVVIIGALVGGALAGILGILLAAPTIAGARALLGYAYRKITDQEPFLEPEIPDLRLLWGELVRQRDVAAILFDLDGTLVETDDYLSQWVARSIRISPRILPPDRRLALARRGVMAVEGPGNLIVTLLDRLGLDNAAFRFRRWLRRASGVAETPCCECVSGSAEALRVLRSRGYLLGVVTSRDHSETDFILQNSNLRQFVGAVVTREDSSRMKPHPMPVRLAAEKLGIAPEQCIMVGDTSVDVRAGKAAGALAVGVRCGFGQDGDFNEADLVLDRPDQLLEWL